MIKITNSMPDLSADGQEKLTQAFLINVFLDLKQKMFRDETFRLFADMPKSKAEPIIKAFKERLGVDMVYEGSVDKLEGMEDDTFHDIKYPDVYFPAYMQNTEAPTIKMTQLLAFLASDEVYELDLEMEYALNKMIDEKPYSIALLKEAIEIYHRDGLQYADLQFISSESFRNEFFGRFRETLFGDDDFASLDAGMTEDVVLDIIKGAVATSLSLEFALATCLHEDDPIVDETKDISELEELWSYLIDKCIHREKR